MERRFPLVEIGLETAERLLERMPGASRPSSLDLLAGGHINTNYAIDLADGRRVVLRIFASGEGAFHKESKVLADLPGTVEVPRLHLAVHEPEFFEFPYTVVEWIDGSPLNATLTARPEDAVAIGEAVAATLWKIGRHELPAHPAPPFLEFVRSCLFERGAEQWLGPGPTARLWAFVQAQSAFLENLSCPPSLIHCDFQGDNILLREEAGAWKVAAVLDWEWAQNGCYLKDLGSLLRFDGEPSADFHHGLESGFARLGRPLPAEWRKAARIWDLAAHSEKLAYPRHRGEVTLRSIRIIERCLRDYAG
jgi:aminoglycoside phosphotransferase (APT) family kinase protein